ncbi:MAG: peptide ABC transporter substrate-binding protein, partial [Caldilinea sp.]|nr:peptide ABC transporter substrate-binding protein [Caldilinea sp.]
MKRRLYLLLAISLIAAMVLAACGAPAAPSGGAAPEAAAPAATGPVVNRLGITLPDDALPLEQQVFRFPADEQKYMTWDASVYAENEGDVFGWADSCVRPDKDFNPQPNICESWTVSDDGLLWTFNLQQDKVWSDGTPLTANDFVFTFQRYARPDYDFEWFYSMMGIKNWSQVVSGEVAPEELGVKAVDDYTLTIETDYPVPYLIKIMADAWVVPQHIVKDRLDDGTWALNPDNYVSAGPFV